MCLYFYHLLLLLDDDDDEIETCYKNIIDIKEKTGLFLLECQDLMSQLQCRIKSLSQSLLQSVPTTSY